MSEENAEEPLTNAAAQGGAAPAPAPLPVLSYATPDQFRSEILRDGGYIVLPHGVDLPDRCIRCGQLADVRIALSIRFLVPLRQVNIHVGLCHRHFSRYRKPRLVLGWLFAAAGLALCATGFAKLLSDSHATRSDLFGREFFGLTALAISAALFFVKAPYVWGQKANATAAWIGGAGERFLRPLSPINPGSTKSIYRGDDSESP